MNFITHYALDREGPSSYFTLGVAIPDLLPLAGRQLRVPYKKLNDHAFTDEPEPEQWLLRGVLHHYYTDRIFHESAFFQAERARIQPFLQQLFHQNPHQRYFFLTHIFVEFYLDRVIQILEPEIAVEFYQHFRLVDFDRAIRSLENFSQTSFESLGQHLAVFRDREYLHAYRDDAGFLYALNRTIKRTGITALENFTPDTFHEALKPYEDGLMDRVAFLFPEMQEGFQSIGYPGV